MWPTTTSVFIQAPPSPGARRTRLPPTCIAPGYCSSSKPGEVNPGKGRIRHKFGVGNRQIKPFWLVLQKFWLGSLGHVGKPSSARSARKIHHRHSGQCLPNTHTANQNKCIDSELVDFQNCVRPFFTGIMFTYQQELCLKSLNYLILIISTQYFSFSNDRPLVGGFLSNFSH